ncbi:hypothetical protein DA2_2186 [Desulfovibrio sp. A2]|nr:hypothetical protein DA2_2186 [Desulfovibrio sp. A2]
MDAPRPPAGGQNHRKRDGGVVPHTPRRISVAGGWCGRDTRTSGFCPPGQADRRF